VSRLVSRGSIAPQMKIDLEQQGFATDAIEQAHDVTSREVEDKRNSRLLALRDIFDRVGYGAATPQVVNILFYLSAQAWPYILFVIGLLNGAKTLLSVVWSSILQEYDALHRVHKRTISAGGIVFGFSFLLLSFALLARNVWLFCAAFLIGTIGIVAYGDLYGKFVESVIRKERMGAFLRGMAHWGVLITAASMLATGLLLDVFPQGGKVWTFSLFGSTHSLRVYGYLLAFEATALAFILSGYITSFVRDSRDTKAYPLWRFFGEYAQIMRGKARVFWSSKYTSLLTVAGLVLGLLQIIVTAYAGIAIYKILAARYDVPFFALSIVYAIAIIAAFTGPYFTQKVHRSTGLAPTLVFGTLLMAVLPLVLAFSAHIAAIAAALCLHVIGGAIVGFAQGLITKKLLPDDVRKDYFRAQSVIIIVPYVLLIPALAWIANTVPLSLTFLGVAIGLVAVVMPIYFWLVVVSQRMHL
jgi:hypothetical protein